VESGQRSINQDSFSKAGVLHDQHAATRGQSLSREVRKPQNESVKKNMVIESIESSVESLAGAAARKLRELPMKHAGNSPIEVTGRTTS